MRDVINRYHCKQWITGTSVTKNHVKNNYRLQSDNKNSTINAKTQRNDLDDQDSSTCPSFQEQLVYTVQLGHIDVKIHRIRRLSCYCADECYDHSSIIVCSGPTNITIL